MAFCKPAGMLHIANGPDANAFEDKVAKNYVEQVDQFNAIHGEQRGIQSCSALTCEADSKEDKDSIYGPFVAKLLLNVRKVLKEKAMERAIAWNALAKTNEQLAKRNQELEQQLAAQLTECSSGKSDGDAHIAEQKKNKTATLVIHMCFKAFDDEEFQRVEDAKRMSQVKHDDVTKMVKELTDLKSQLEELMALKYKLKNVSSTYMQASEQMKELQSNKLLQGKTYKNQFRTGAEKIDEGDVVIQEGTQIIYKQLQLMLQVRCNEAAKKAKALSELLSELATLGNPYQQASDQMKELQSNTLPQGMKHHKRWRDVEGKAEEGTKRRKSGHTAIQKGPQVIYNLGNITFV